jgi:hypothetical protein
MMFEGLRKEAILFFVLLSFFSTAHGSPLHAQSRAQRGSMAPATNSPPVGKSNTEKQILAVLDDMDRNNGRV